MDEKTLLFTEIENLNVFETHNKSKKDRAKSFFHWNDDLLPELTDERVIHFLKRFCSFPDCFKTKTRQTIVKEGRQRISSYMDCLLLEKDKQRFYYSGKLFSEFNRNLILQENNSFSFNQHEIFFLTMIAYFYSQKEFEIVLVTMSLDMGRLPLFFDRKGDAMNYFNY
jgi:hypothetical protein